MKWHLRYTAILGVFCLLAAAFANAQEPQKDKKDPSDKKEVKTPNYYPLQLGNQWTFRVEVGGNAVNAISTIAKIETIDNVPLARLEASINDKIAATEHLSQNDKGIFRHRNNGQEISPPICLMKYPAKAGAKWDGEITVGKEKGKYFCETAEETIEVTAGKFKTMRVAIKLESNGQTINTTYWFVPEVGFVKQTVETGNLNIVMELEKFEKAKDKKKK